jgi:ATP-dependent DNA helicase HFM1/MER3
MILSVKATLRYLNRKGPPHWLKRVPALTFLAENVDGTLLYFWRGSVRMLCKEGGYDLMFSVGLQESSVTSRIAQITCHFSCEDIVGTIVSKTLNHTLSNLVVPSSTITASTGIGREHNIERSKHDDQEDYLHDDDNDYLDMIVAAEQASTQPSIHRTREVPPEEETDEYLPLEELLVEKQVPDKFDTHLACADQSIPFERLPNGNWRCTHPCSGGVLTRQGRPCSHRCCKEGMKKPPEIKKPPEMRVKRGRPKKVERDLSDSQQMKRPRVQQKQEGPLTHAFDSRMQLVLTEPTLTLGSPSSSPVTSPKKVTTRRKETPPKNVKNIDLDGMDLECIDLTLSDTDTDDLWDHPERLRSANGGGSTRNEPNTAGVLDTEDPKTSSPQQVGVPSTQSIPSVQLHGRECPTSDTPSLVTQPGTSYDRYLDLDSVSLLEVLSPLPALTPASASDAFTSGASDEMLFPGISELDGTEVLSVRDTSSDTLPGMSPTAPNVTSRDEENGAGGVNQSLENQDCNREEPAWLAEFDQEFVDLFRGYVTFV